MFRTSQKQAGGRRSVRYLGSTCRERTEPGWFFRHRKMSLRRVFQRRARAVRFRLSWRGHFHSYQFAYPAFGQGHAVENIGLGNGTLVVGDDDELALRDEPLQLRPHQRPDFILPGEFSTN